MATNTHTTSRAHSVMIAGWLHGTLLSVSHTVGQCSCVSLGVGAGVGSFTCHPRYVCFVRC